MRITIVHGQNHRGSTYHVAWMLAEKLGGEITEFFLPRDFGSFCTGCCTCFTQSETQCPHYQKLLPITRALDGADIIILASPVYVYHVTGAMKALLDHYGYRWMVHRPQESMFVKQAVAVSTAAGAGMSSANQDMAHSLFYWGVGRIERLGLAVAETAWERVSPKKKDQARRKTDQLAKKLLMRNGRVKPGLKTRLYFWVLGWMQKKAAWNPADAAYWKEKGWTKGCRPW